MALNIQSGQTWAEIRAELNNKVFDKNGDELVGSVYDTNGNEVFKIDAETQRVYSYGRDGESVYGEKLSVKAGDISITIPKGMKRGICCIEINEQTYSSAQLFRGILHFNTIKGQSKLIGWHLNFSVSTTRDIVSYNDDYIDGYIDGEELKIHVSDRAGVGGSLNLYWEVW